MTSDNTRLIKLFIFIKSQGNSVGTFIIYLVLIKIPNYSLIREIYKRLCVVFFSYYCNSVGFIIDYFSLNDSLFTSSNVKTILAQYTGLII